MSPRSAARREGRIITAHHEAGHAVLGLIVGREIDYVTIVPESGIWMPDGRPAVSLGYTHFVSTPDVTRHEVLMSAVHTFGGAAAEIRLGKHVPEGCQDDINEAAGMVAQLGGDTPALLEEMFDTAMALMDRDDVWRGVRALARALLKESPRTEGAEATRIIHAAMGVKLRISKDCDVPADPSEGVPIDGTCCR